MKSEQEIRKYLAEIGSKIDSLYWKFKHKKISDEDYNVLTEVLQTREDMLEWVLEDAGECKDE